MNTSLAADFLEAIRISELSRIEQILEKTVPVGVRILEIGAGTGWQARRLSSRGYDVSAIDIPSSNHRHARIWPIVDFDGRLIPFPDESFDVVYSSNVLEHVEDIDTLNREITRVLRPEGIAVHYVPTAAWRAWSLLAFYPALLRDVFRRLTRRYPYLPQGLSTNADAAVLIVPPGPQRSLLQKILHRIVPHAHGAVGSPMSELNNFQRRSWNAFFSDAGWNVMSYQVNGLFLTGEMMLGAVLPIERRKRLSQIFGSTAHLYVLTHGCVANRRQSK